MRILKIAIVAALPFMFAGVASANEYEPQLREMAKNSIQSWLSDPSVIKAIRAQNQQNNALDETKIVALDKQWRAETGASSRPMIDRVMENSLSAFLKSKKDGSEGLFTEIFVMDNKGLNVGQSDVTSDYWQGDEAKWQKTYSVGADALHIGKVKEDESTQTFQSQVSLSVVDPKDGSVIGAITVGVNVEMLGQ
ncbi:MAG: hypothetical protein OSB58_04155 [Alphaproteobacteria bacterium]|nr:hypothetical protein [Alphaproteobacteria bacterium]